jgi:hypothetical protein
LKQRSQSSGIGALKSMSPSFPDAAGKLRMHTAQEEDIYGRCGAGSGVRWGARWAYKQAGGNQSPAPDRFHEAVLEHFLIFS